MADPDPYATNKYLVKQLNKFNLAYLHMVKPRTSGATDTEGAHQDHDLTLFRKLFIGTFMAAGEPRVASSFCFTVVGAANLPLHRIQVQQTSPLPVYTYIVHSSVRSRQN